MKPLIIAVVLTLLIMKLTFLWDKRLRAKRPASLWLVTLRPDVPGPPPREEAPAQTAFAP